MNQNKMKIAPGTSTKTCLGLETFEALLEETTEALHTFLSRGNQLFNAHRTTLE